MPLETGTTIADLNPAWPLGSDQKAQGDDHLRLIKAVVQGDVASLADGGTFVTPPTVPSGSTGLQVVNAGDVPGLAGTGPVDIVEADVAAGWQVQGDMLVQWGLVTSDAGGNGSVTYFQPYAPGVQPSVQLTVNLSNFALNSEAHVSDSQSDGFDWYSGIAGVSAGVNAWFIAIGEAPDALKKPKTVQTIGGSELQEFHDPAGLASWRIVGGTLECWGVVNLTGSGTGTVTFPRTFARAPVVTAIGTAIDSGQVWFVAINNGAGGVTTTQVAFASADDTGASINLSVRWRVVGEWDGVTP